MRSPAPFRHLIATGVFGGGVVYLACRNAYAPPVSPGLHFVVPSERSAIEGLHTGDVITTRTVATTVATIGTTSGAVAAIWTTSSAEATTGSTSSVVATIGLTSSAVATIGSTSSAVATTGSTSSAVASARPIASTVIPTTREPQRAAPIPVPELPQGVRLHFVISNAGPDPPPPDCGGCKALYRLRQLIAKQGHSAVGTPRNFNALCGAMKNPTKFINILVLPEVVGGGGCAKANLTVRWMLAPAGIQRPKKITASWPGTDLVFNFGVADNGAARHVPLSNLLQAQTNPQPGDLFELKRYPKKPRSGTAWTWRKASKFHKNIVPIHKKEDYACPRELPMEAYVQAYLTHEYFICYDPYSYHSQIAAMLGCVSIVYPIEGMSQKEYWMSTLYAGYFEDNNLTDMKGIAYGNSPEQIDHARRTLGGAREEMIRVREWGEQVSLPRFVRDTIRYTVGKARSGFEGALLVKDFYPNGWWKG